MESRAPARAGPRQSADLDAKRALTLFPPRRRRAPRIGRKSVASDPDADAATASPENGATFAALPAEIHLLIIRHLIYPDALSMKHTCRYFYYFVDTGIRLKVDWLIQRRSLHLECPRDRQCDLGSDSRFCRGSVRLLMQRRREHMECEGRPNLGCLVYGTPRCTHRHRLAAARLRRRLDRLGIPVDAWTVLAAISLSLFLFYWLTDARERLAPLTGLL